MKIRIYNDIDKPDEFFCSFFGVEQKVFSLEAVKNILEKNQDEKEFEFDIHCDGGSVTEGLAIYDLLRGSGKNIKMNIDGSCHSMAVTLLLSAPKENRTANKHSKALIHPVSIGVGGMYSAEELETLNAEIKDKQNKILNIYAERTGSDRTELEELMNKSTILDTDELMRLGFISKINPYTTNKKVNNKNQINMKKEVLDLVNRSKAIYNKVFGVSGAKNYDFKDDEGNILFSTDLEEDTLEVGMSATLPEGETSGTFEIGDKIVVITDNVIESIELKESPVETEEIENLKKEVETLKNSLKESLEINTKLSNELKSNYTPKNRRVNASKGNAKMSAEDYKAQMKERSTK